MTTLTRLQVLPHALREAAKVIEIGDATLGVCLAYEALVGWEKFKTECPLNAVPPRLQRNG